MTIDVPAAMAQREERVDRLAAPVAQRVVQVVLGELADRRVGKVVLGELEGRPAALVGRAERASRVAGPTGRVATATRVRIGRVAREMHVRIARVATGTRVLRARERAALDPSAAEDLIVRERLARAAEQVVAVHPGRVGIRSAAHPLAVKDAAIPGVNAIPS